MLPNKENYSKLDIKDRKKIFFDTFTFGSMFEIKRGYSIQDSGRNFWIDKTEEMIVIDKTDDISVLVFYIKAQLKGRLYIDSECFRLYTIYYKKII
jgi:hypothetical protein